MKKLLSLLSISLLLFACNSQSNQSSTKEESAVEQTIDKANLETIEIAVYGMTCGGCERTVQNAVGNLPGVHSVKASHQDSTAIVTFDKSKTNFSKMKATITDKGYDVVDFKVVE